ncbi:MAG: IS630 family transposase [Planctomycetia bacterium]|nr:IS630 family transposase [Planctomycetia bacterium]
MKRAIDCRKLDRSTQEHVRKLAIQRIQAGESATAVARSLGFYRTNVYRWLRSYRRGGDAALNRRKAPGAKPKLTEGQKRKVRQWIVGKDPRQYGFDFGLWTRKIVGALIFERFGISYTLPAVGRLLAQLEITPQKPLRRAYQRDEEAVRRWKEQTYPQLRRRSKRRGADIFFLDEAGFQSDSPLGRTYGLKGRTPIVKTSGKRQRVNAISAVNARGAFWYKTYGGKLNSGVFIHFLKDFLRGRARPVLLVVDGLPAHKAKGVSAHVQSLEGRLELHFLPPYAPDLNPDEFVWNHAKQNGVSKRPLRANESLVARVNADLENIKRRKSLVRSFFKAESVSYTTY